jgi:hypothetical protein
VVNDNPAALGFVTQLDAREAERLFGLTGRRFQDDDRYRHSPHPVRLSRDSVIACDDAAPTTLAQHFLR